MNERGGDGFEFWLPLGLVLFLGAVGWVSNLRSSQKRLQTKVHVAEKLQEYIAMPDKRRRDYLDELKVKIQEYRVEERLRVEKLRNSFRDRNGSVWHKLKKWVFFSDLGQFRHGFVVTRSWGEIEISRSHWLIEELTQMEEVNEAIRKFHMSESMREYFTKGEKEA